MIPPTPPGLPVFKAIFSERNSVLCIDLHMDIEIYTRRIEIGLSNGIVPSSLHLLQIYSFLVVVVIDLTDWKC